MVENSVKAKSSLQSKFNTNDFFARYPKLGVFALYAGVSLFILVTFAILLALFNVYPFGPYSISSYDMSAQVAPFIEHFYDVIDGKSSLFYSYSIAGGADVFGTLAYCCVSPFTFIFLFFGRGNVYYGTAIVLPLKIVCVAISGLYYVRKRFPEIHPIMQVILALCYAFCGYLFVSNTYINWVDLLIYLPFLAYGFYKIVNCGQKRVFTISLALMIYTCFSISCFSLFIIFPLVVAFCFFAIPKEEGKRVLVDCVWAMFLGIVISLPILIPALRAFLVSGRKTGIFENINAEYSYMALYKKSSYIFSDTLTVFFTLSYFVKNGIKNGKSKFLALAGVLLLIPVVIDESMNLLNFGSYMSYSLRFGFLNSFYFLFVACCFVSEYTFELRMKKQEVTLKNNLIFGSLFTLLSIVFAVGLIFFNNVLQGDSFVEYFPSRFAHSLGGLEVTAILFGCVGLIALLGGILVNYHKLSTKIIVPVLLLTMCSQTVFYTANLVSGNHSDHSNFEQIGVLTDYVEELEGNNHTRVKMNGDYVTACMPFTLHTNAFTVFSSVIDSRNFVPTTFFKFGGNGKNSMKSYNGQYLGDVIFGNQYYIYDTTKSSSRKFLEEVEGYDAILDKNGNVKDTGKYILYKNKYAFPHAIVVENAKTKYAGGEYTADYDAILKMLGGEGFGIEVFIPEVKEQSPGVFRVKNNIVGAGNYFFSSKFEDPTNVLYIRSNYVEEDLKPIAGNENISLGYTDSASGSYSIYIKAKEGTLTKEEVEKACTAFKISNEQISRLYAKVTSTSVEFDIAPNVINVKTTAKEGEYLFLNYVALPGHTVLVNGQERSFEANALGFMLIELSEGENVVQITYKSPYSALIGLGLLASIVICSLYLVVRKKAIKFINALDKPLYYLAIGLGALLLAFFFVMPTVVCAYKNVSLLIKSLIALF